MPAFLRNFQADKTKMYEYIASTVARVDMEGISYSSNENIKAIISQELFLMGASPEGLEKERNEILSTTDEDIRGFAGMIKAVMKQNCYCVSGSQAGIEKDKDLFTEIIKVKKK